MIVILAYLWNSNETIKLLAMKNYFGATARPVKNKLLHTTDPFLLKCNSEIWEPKTVIKSQFVKKIYMDVIKNNNIHTQNSTQHEHSQKIIALPHHPK